MIMFFSISGVILGVSIIFFLFSFEGSFQHRYPRLVTLVISGGLTFTHVTIAGQLIEEGLTFIEILSATEWYCWNIQNRKTFALLLQNAQKIFKVQFSENISVNYELGISIGKSIYSMVSVLAQLRNK
ncbi:uncharacterized protein LOC123014901 isoform X2 [Tribolium madens]|uniref:uncharacterized protein LOC123014901 isoform X2 n=1 Tax=Tribolium madens TaxID=41895 RepID=UPI001CF730AE|nr:uncharacterized protein LOC123014901 isoform X2 [Tribolium madens]